MRFGMSVTRCGHKIFAAAWLAGATLALMLVPGAGAQMGGQAQSQQQQPPPSAIPPSMPGQQQAPPPAEPPRDPEEEKAYKTFYDVAVTDPDKEIEVGVPFVEKYAKSRYAEQVYARLTQAYYNKQNLNKMYEYGDKALALDPNDVTVLTLIGWVLPHDASAPDFEARLKKAETFEKRALEKLATMQAPAGMTDEQFAKAKAQLVAQAHSGLGLVYFRQNKTAEAASELKLATEGNPSADPTDYYVMGLQLEKLDRESEAADAFQKCAASPNSLQSRCKQNSEDARKKATAQKPKS
jgi:tetratricopeptide (TPR) repeat protein